MNPDSLKFQEAGGPKIPVKYGRVDVSEPKQCPEEGRLPGKLTVKEEISNSKKNKFGNCFQNQNNKNKFDNKKRQKIYMIILEIDLLE